MRLTIKNGLIIDPANNIEEIGTLYVEDGKIVGMARQDEIFSGASRFSVNDTETIDAKGKWVVPGLIDMHVHFREPGHMYKEDIKSGSKAAKKAGFSAVLNMANTKPVVDNPKLVKYILDKGKEAGLVNVMAVGAITVGMGGEELTDFDALKKAGITALSEDGKSVMSEDLMRKAMEKAKKLDLLILDHTEDHSLSGGFMNEGLVSYGLNLEGIPREAEDSIVKRDIRLGEETGCRLHIQHVSTKGSIELIRAAKKRGVNITAETAPHYFALTEWEIVNQRIIGEKPLAKTNMKMNPPLRTKDDMLAVREGLRDGTIDVIATDHAPHSEGDKALSFERAPFGIIGLETAFPVSYTYLVKDKILTPMELIKKMSTNPAKILGIQGGTLSVGAIANITIIDVESEYEINSEGFASKSRNTPFDGLKVWGKII